MRSRIKIVAVIGILTAALLYLRTKPKEVGQIETIAPPKPALPQPRQKERMAELYSSPRAPLSAPQREELSEECLVFWNEIRALNAKQITDIPQRKNCGAFPELAEKQEAFLRHCEGTGRTTPACEQAFLSYRSALTEKLTEKTPVTEISDPKVLTDKLIARLGDISNPEKIEEVARRLLSIEPDMYPAAQALLTSTLQNAQRAAGKPDDERWNKVEEALNRAASFNENPKQTLETRLMIERERYHDPIRVREKAAEIDKAYPQLGVGPYHSAWAEFQSGNPTRAREFLQEAIRREPEEIHYRQSLEKMNRGEAHPFKPQDTVSVINPG